MASLKRVDIIFFDAGGGHRAAANALKLSIEKQGLPWDVRLVNLQEVLDAIDIFRQVFRLRLEDVYNLLLRKGWTLGSGLMLHVMHALIWLYHPLQVRLLMRYWRKHPADLVISVVPNFDRALGEALRKVLPQTPFAIVITDIADYPPRFWLERQKQIVFAGSAKAEQQAKELGGPETTVVRTSGMVLHPRFYEPIETDRRAERQRLGLDPDLPTGLILFGGYGSNVMLKIVRELAPFAGKLQLIAICGKNESLRKKLTALNSPVKLFVEGFTSQVPNYMHLSDFFIGKPGPGSISEALRMKLPVIVERNAWTLPQERYNADWVLENEVGAVVANFDGIAEAIRRLLEPATFAKYRANAAAIDNQAVFEIPRLLENILER